jgi:hypothetical protein
MCYNASNSHEIKELERIGNRAKESLIVDFINRTDINSISDKASIIDASSHSPKRNSGAKPTPSSLRGIERRGGQALYQGLVEA